MLEDTICQLTVHNSTSQLERIGQGFCGTVWGEVAKDGRPNSDRQLAMKREDGGPGRSITNEYRIHKRLLECLKSLDTTQISTIFGVSGIPFNIPGSEAFIDENAPEWADILPPTPYRLCPMQGHNQREDNARQPAISSDDHKQFYPRRGYRQDFGHPDKQTP
ncbi:uncharacterized protein TrAtP1_000582 [Trichoderma atroviride]|uniref:uncharacterized protein n=1 Tax=Hypocrea atroviridis TaxID=63577 RepID=UPI003329539A|nr:hypothetical protein TrAtP1_000582 [Trichoderma atroviride]